MMTTNMHSNMISTNYSNNCDTFGDSKLSNFNKLDTIGKGAYGVVCRAVDLRTN